MLCMMLCIPSISAFVSGGTNRTTGAYASGDELFFKVENLSVGISSASTCKEVFKDSNYVLVADEITFRFGIILPWMANGVLLIQQVGKLAIT